MVYLLHIYLGYKPYYSAVKQTIEYVIFPMTISKRRSFPEANGKIENGVEKQPELSGEGEKDATRRPKCG